MSTKNIQFVGMDREQIEKLLDEFVEYAISKHIQTHKLAGSLTDVIDIQDLMRAPEAFLDHADYEAMAKCTHEYEWIGGGSTPDGPIEPNAACKHCGIAMDAEED